MKIALAAGTTGQAVDCGVTGRSYRWGAAAAVSFVPLADDLHAVPAGDGALARSQRSIRGTSLYSPGPLLIRTTQLCWHCCGERRECTACSAAVRWVAGWLDAPVQLLPGGADVAWPTVYEVQEWAKDMHRCHAVQMLPSWPLMSTSQQQALELASCFQPTTRASWFDARFTTLRSRARVAAPGALFVRPPGQRHRPLHHDAA